MPKGQYWTREEGEAALKNFGNFVLQIMMIWDELGDVEHASASDMAKGTLHLMGWLNARTDQELQDIWNFLDFTRLMNDDVRGMVEGVASLRGLAIDD